MTVVLIAIQKLLFVIAKAWDILSAMACGQEWTVLKSIHRLLGMKPRLCQTLFAGAERLFNQPASSTIRVEQKVVSLLWI